MKILGATVVVPWWDLALTAPGQKEGRDAVVRSLGAELSSVRMQRLDPHQPLRL